MVDLRSILDEHRSKKNKKTNVNSSAIERKYATFSDIPDVFFDDILVDFKLTRIEVMILMYIYRKVWCRPNLYKIYGISQLMSHTDMAKNLGLIIEDVHHGLRMLEGYGFITTIHLGQYFVRKYFTKELDDYYSQTYDDFEV